jgi:hypothetical protein
MPEVSDDIRAQSRPKPSEERAAGVTRELPAPVSGPTGGVEAAGGPKASDSVVRHNRLRTGGLTNSRLEDRSSAPVSQLLWWADRLDTVHWLPTTLGSAGSSVRRPLAQPVCPNDLGGDGPNGLAASRIDVHRVRRVVAAEEALQALHGQRLIRTRRVASSRP